nr:NADH-quinone oxidoreductase subunit J [Verrucomicrobiota bacterium]
MQDALFYLFAFLTLVFGFLVVANPFSRNPVTSAMFLVLAIISLAGLFVLLHAFFLAAVQVLVYAGAVIVLFLFVIMLLDLKAEEQRKLKAAGVAGGVLAAGALLAIFLASLW